VSVVLVDSGGANIGSVRSALARQGVEPRMSIDAAEIRAASHVILPGVGAGAPGKAPLGARGLDKIIPALTQPVLGICLGMQLLFESSEESDTPCLGVLPGRVRRFDAARCGRVPHMGWNRLEPRRASPLLDGVDGEAYAYFVHSYAAEVTDATVASCDYGGAFAAVVSRGNFHGAQFHPERSARVGARLLRNFLELRA
jgi:glutamine amidotransferase